MKVISVILLILFTTFTTQDYPPGYEEKTHILEPFYKFSHYLEFFNDHRFYFSENQEVSKAIYEFIHVMLGGDSKIHKITDRKRVDYLRKHFRLSANQYEKYKATIEKFLRSPNGIGIPLGEHASNLYQMYNLMYYVAIRTKDGFEVYGNNILRRTGFPRFFNMYKDKISSLLKCAVMVEQLDRLPTEKLTTMLEMLARMSRLDENTKDYLFDVIQHNEIPDKKNVQVREIRWDWHTLDWVKYEECAALFLQKIEPYLHIFTGKLTQETLESLSNEEFEQEKKAVDDLLELGCGDLKMDLASVLGKFSPKFSKVLGNIDMKTDNNQDKEDELNDADFQTATDLFQSYKNLDEEQENKLMDLLQRYRLFGARTFFQQMKNGGEYTMRTMSIALKEMRSCSRQKMEDILVMAKAWRNGIDTKEASDRLRALFEASKCEMLREVSSEREKVIEQVVGILEDSFGFVSCKKKGVEKVEVNKTSEAVEEFVKGLSNSPVVFDDWIFDALNNTSDELLKTSAKFSEGCQNLLKLAEAPFKINIILNSMPDPKLLQVLNYNKSWSELLELSQSTLDLLHKFEKLKVAEQEQLVQHHPMLQQLSDARHSLLDLTSCATRLAACGRLEEFLEVLSIWRLASEEARTRVLRLLEVSSCEVVDELANGGEQVDKLVALLDKYFGTESCVAKKAKEDRTKHYTDFK